MPIGGLCRIGQACLAATVIHAAEQHTGLTFKASGVTLRGSAHAFF
jgi:hypothetical protein